MTAVKITSMVVTAQYGTLSPGDILRTNKDFAAHLVNDCAAAKYIDAPAEEALTPAAVERVKAKPGRKPK